MLYMITLESNNRFKDYANFSAAISRQGENLQILRQSWLLYTTSATVRQITAAIRPQIDERTDRLFVAQINARAMDGWMSKAQWDWANGHNS